MECGSMEWDNLWYWLVATVLYNNTYSDKLLVKLHYKNMLYNMLHNMFHGGRSPTNVLEHKLLYNIIPVGDGVYTMNLLYRA